jgi:hypothetical protein
MSGSGQGRFRQPCASMPQINSIWAFVALDPDDGNEGIIGMSTPAGMMPMIASDKVRLDELTPIAEHVAAVSGRDVKLVKFSRREVLRVISHGTHG